MGARFRRRRTSRGEAVKQQALGPLGIVRGWSGRGGKTYGAVAVGLGFGALLIVTGTIWLLLRRRRRAARDAVLPRVRDLMTLAPVTIEPQASVVEAAKKMIQEEKGPLPVVEGDGRPV